MSATLTKIRPSRSKYESMCGTCLGVVGVRTTPFNKAKPSDVVYKITAHRTATDQRCPGSMLSVHPDAVVAVR